MKTRGLLAVIATVGSLWAPTFAHAQASEDTGAAILQQQFQFLSVFSSLRNSCPPPKSDAFKSTQEAEAAYGIAIKSKQYCDIAEAAGFLAYDEKSQQPEVWAVRSIQALNQMKDSHSATVEGLRFLKALADLPNERLESLRLNVLDAVYRASMTLGTQNDMTWTEWGLGIGAEAQDDGRDLSFMAFLEDYPQSTSTNKVKSQALDLKKIYLTKELQISDEMLKNRNSFGALTRLEYLYAYPQLFDSPLFTTVVERIVSTQDIFIKEIPSYNEIRLHNILRLDPNVKIDRRAVVQDSETKLCQLITTWKTINPDWQPSSSTRSIEQRRCSKK